MTRREFFSSLAVAVLALASIGFAQTKANTPVSPNKQAIATQNVKQLLLLMDTDKNGKISKKEWMDFMSDEFDRLDTDKSGELDQKELLQSRVVVRHISPAVQGK
jgi:Ca2+-binding EF-hand superfamily protein